MEAIVIHLKVLVALDLYDFHLAKSLAHRIHLGSILLSCTLLYWHYTGTLVSYFTVESERPPITSLNNIINVPNIKLLMVSGDAFSQYVFNAMGHDEILESKLPQRMQWFQTTDQTNGYLERLHTFMTSENSSKLHLLVLDKKFDFANFITAF